MNKVKIFTLVFIPLLCSCNITTETKIDKSVIASEYDVSEQLNIQFYQLDYDSFTNKQKSKSFKYPILISRSDCEYCINAIKTLDEFAKEKETTINLYLLDSNSIDIEDKQQMIDDYSISSVPTFILMDNQSISDIETGYLSEELINKIMKGQ